MPRVKVQSVETVEGCTHEVSTTTSNRLTLQMLVFFVLPNGLVSRMFSIEGLGLKSFMRDACNMVEELELSDRALGSDASPAFLLTIILSKFSNLFEHCLFNL